MEITGGKGYVQVNGKVCQQDSKVILIGGDEIVFGSSGKHAYVSFLLKYIAFMIYIHIFGWPEPHFSCVLSSCILLFSTTLYLLF